MRFGQLIECNMRNIFLEKPYTKCDEETSSGLFSEKLKLSIPLDEILPHFPQFLNNNISLVTLLIEQVFLSSCLYFMRYWAIYVLKLFVNQVVTS